MKTNKTLVSFELNDEALDNVYGGSGLSSKGYTVYECINLSCRRKRPKPGYWIGTPMVKCGGCQQMTLDPYIYVKGNM